MACISFPIYFNSLGGYSLLLIGDKKVENTFSVIMSIGSI